MTEREMKNAAKRFAEEWKDKGREDEHCHKFWLDLMQNILGIENAISLIDFEEKVRLKNGGTKKIDAYLADARVLIEQKSENIDLDKPQKGHDEQTPFEQAKFYDDHLPYNEKSRYIIVSNFKEIRIYNMAVAERERKPAVIMLSELPEKFHALDILSGKKIEEIRLEEKISTDAGRITGRLYDSLLRCYVNPDGEETLRSLNQLCVRLVFCLYAEDSGVFGKNQFHDYINELKPSKIQGELKALFKMLDTPDNERDPDDEPKLLAFPYVNGGLFADESVKIPQFDEETKRLLLDEASAGIDWSGISPTIFGAVFESTLSSKMRRSGGMHYTSIEDIHKVIDPLFLDDLKAELNEILALRQNGAIVKRVGEFQRKLSELVFLDPACGSGNFLTETYLSLRRLENKALEKLYGLQQRLNDSKDGGIIKVKISQFYGMEINDFAVTVAKTALWIAEIQMLHETENIVRQEFDCLPLKTNAYIFEGNALRMDWAQVVPPDRLSYIMGNPPFVGYSNQSKEQKEDILSVWTDEKGKPYKSAGKLDYVSAWYFKAAQYIYIYMRRRIRCAFVSTNSITQGEQVAPIWRTLFERFGVHIDFAWRTFKWSGEAAVHCVIVGFGIAENPKPRMIFDGDSAVNADNINPHLVDGKNVFIESRNKPLCDVPEMVKGSIPVDDGYFFFTEDEYNNFIANEPCSIEYIKKFYGAREFLHNEKRWCLWLVDILPNALTKMPHVMKRVRGVREFRLKSTKAATRKFADYSTRFMEIRQPKTQYILVPSHSSENREYIPIGFESPEIICGNANFIIPNATLYHFGVLTSSVHMAWVRTVCGRLKSDYRYSNTIVYNNFPWCNPTPEQKAEIEQTAQAILDARAKFPDCSLADLYGENMYVYAELCQAHKANDRAVLQAYGMKKDISEREIVSGLMKMYRQMSYTDHQSSRD